jgi:hypothetical protein
MSKMMIWMHSGKVTAPWRKSFDVRVPMLILGFGRTFSQSLHETPSEQEYSVVAI